MKIFRSGELYWWRYLEITTDLLKVADNTVEFTLPLRASDSAPFFVGSCYSSSMFSLFCFLLLFFFNLSSFCVLWPKLFVSLECPFLIVPFTIPWRLCIVSSTPHQVTLAVSGTKSTGKCIYNWHAISVNLFLVNKWFEWHLVVLNVA